MSVRRFDHYNIRTPDVPETVNFYSEVLGMSVVPSPVTDDITKSCWLADAAGVVAIHVGSTGLAYPGDQPGERPDAVEPGTNRSRIHHIAFDCTDHADMVGQIASRSLPHWLNDIPEIPLRQIFVRDPNGILIELNFR